MSAKTFDWTAATYRIFGTANILFVLIGLLYLVPTAWSVSAGVGADVSAESHFATWFWAMTACNLIFLSILVVGAIQLFKLRPSGVTICNFLFVGEIIYFLTIGLLWSALTVASGVAAASGIGNMGVSPQILCGYPLVALVCLNFARRKRAKTLVAAPVSVSSF
jgi:hypothetical protein